MKSVDLKSGTYINFNKMKNKEDFKFNVGDHVRISKYKNIFAKGFVPNWSAEVFVITKVKDTVPWIFVISDPIGEEIVRKFYKNELQKAKANEFGIEKVIKRKGHTLYVIWKGYDYSFNSWIDKNVLLSENDFFPPYIYSKNEIDVELDLFNYAAKSDLKNAKGVDISLLTKKDDLANLKSKVNKLDIDKLSELDTDKLKPAPVWGFLSRPFTNHSTASEVGGHFINSSLPLPPASQTLIN